MIRPPPRSTLTDTLSPYTTGVRSVLSLGYLAGFPPADLYWCGPSIIVNAYSQPAADAAADALAGRIAALEPEFVEPLLTPDEGVRQAMAIAAEASRPVVLADTQDTPGCGGTGDNNGLLGAPVRPHAQGTRRASWRGEGGQELE